MTEWRDVSLGDVCELKRGYDLPRGSRFAGTVPIISSSGPTGFHTEAKVRAPGVVTGRYGTLGDVFYITEDFWPLNTALYVRDFKGNNPRYVAGLLQSMDLARYDGAAAVPGLNRNQLHTVPVRIPSADTQRVIASILTAVDDLIENNRRRVAVLEEMAREIYREWFTRFRFPGHDVANFVESALGPVPDTWDVIPASHALTVNPRIRVDRTQSYPFITMGDLDERTMACEPSQYRTGSSGSKFENHDTLFARITPCLENGKTGFVQCLGVGEIGFGSTEFVVLRGRSVGPAYTYCLARSDDFRGHAVASMSGASGRQRVRNECFDSLLLAEPPRELNERFEAAALPMFHACRALQLQSAQLSAMRDLLLPKLVTGQIDVSGLDLDALVDGAVA